ncbi:MAG: sulfite exporter TauE/SafE family protein [Bacteroidetes bacterium]|nr:MAG: sulfite exporter TauE/SafE family protein [Bacteroidota bacterium]
MQIELIILFFLVAFLYSSAGFGGGSSYLAIMALFHLPMLSMRPAALLCNLIVVSGNLLIFWRQGYFHGRKAAPLVLAGLPLAFLGGYWRLSERAFFVLLGFSLIIAAVAMWVQGNAKNRQHTDKELPVVANAGLGGGLGLLAGLTGIGGGIFLSPVLHLLRWDSAKVIAATASLFIFVQSASGLAGQMAQSVVFDWSLILPLLLAVWLGGQIGVRWSMSTLPQTAVRNLTGVLVFYAGINILWHHL